MGNLAELWKQQDNEKVCISLLYEAQASGLQVWSLSSAQRVCISKRPQAILMNVDDRCLGGIYSKILGIALGKKLCRVHFYK